MTTRPLPPLWQRLLDDREWYALRLGPMLWQPYAAVLALFGLSLCIDVSGAGLSLSRFGVSLLAVTYPAITCARFGWSQGWGTASHYDTAASLLKLEAQTPRLTRNRMAMTHAGGPYSIFVAIFWPLGPSFCAAAVVGAYILRLLIFRRLMALTRVVNVELRRRRAEDRERQIAGLSAALAHLDAAAKGFDAEAKDTCP